MQYYPTLKMHPVYHSQAVPGIELEQIRKKWQLVKTHNTPGIITHLDSRVPCWSSCNISDRPPAEQVSQVNGLLLERRDLGGAAAAVALVVVAVVPPADWSTPDRRQS